VTLPTSPCERQCHTVTLPTSSRRTCVNGVAEGALHCWPQESLFEAAPLCVAHRPVHRKHDLGLLHRLPAHAIRVDVVSAILEEARAKEVGDDAPVVSVPHRLGVHRGGGGGGVLKKAKGAVEDGHGGDAETRQLCSCHEHLAKVVAREEHSAGKNVLLTTLWTGQ
jgi:hypothetical protein